MITKEWLEQVLGYEIEEFEMYPTSSGDHTSPDLHIKVQPKQYLEFVYVVIGGGYAN